MMMTKRGLFRIAAVVLMSVLPHIAGAQWASTPNAPYNKPVNSLAKNSLGWIYAASDEVYVSTDDGFSWLRAGLYGEKINAVGVDNLNNIVYAGSYGTDKGIFKSTDYGVTWTPSGQTTGNFWAIATDPGGNTYACGAEGVYKTTDNGISWTGQLGPSTTGEEFLSLGISSEGYVYMGSFSTGSNLSGIYLTYDGGIAWYYSDSPNIIPQTVWSILPDPVTSSVIWAGTQSNGVYKSTDYGVTWEAPAAAFGTVYGLAYSGGVYYIGCGPSASPTSNRSNAVYATTNPTANTWALSRLSGKAIWSITATSSSRAVAGTSGSGAFFSDDVNTSGLTNAWTQSPFSGQIAWSVLDQNGDGQNLFAGGSQLHRTTNGGGVWTADPFFLPLFTQVFRLAQSASGIIYAGTLDEGICASDNSGGSWTQRTLDPGYGIYSITTDNAGNAFAASLYLYKSGNGGQSWTLSLNDPAVWDVAAGSDGTLYASTIYNGIWKSIDGGQNWTNAPLNEFTRTLAIDNTNAVIYAGTYDNGVYKSLDGGLSWLPTPLTGRSIESLVVDNSGNVYAGTLSGVFKSANFGQSWTAFDNGLDFGAIVTKSLYYNRTGAQAGRLYAGTSGSGLLYFDNVSGNGGGTGENTLINSAKLGGGIGVGVGSNGYIVQTVNSGRDWKTLVSGTDKTLNDVAIFTTPSASLQQRGQQTGGLTTGEIFKQRFGSYRKDAQRAAARKAKGTTQSEPAQSPLGTSGFGSAVAVGVGGTILRSTDNGNTWASVSGGSADLMGVAGVSLSAAGKGNAAESVQGFGSAVAVGVGGTILRSTDDGQSWSTVSSSGSTLNSVASAAAPAVVRKGYGVSGTQGFGSAVAVGVGGTILRSTDGGASWQSISTAAAGATNLQKVISDGSATNFTAVGTDGLVIRSVDGGLTWNALSAVADDSPYAPLKFTLKQNYPNPFNPNTLISYQLPTNSEVQLKIFDVLGREVQTLVSERKAAGNHTVSFNGARLASGIYFYRLTARSSGTPSGSRANSGQSDFVQTKKMLLIK
ncbi:MAG: T9SS type A sorting domain-containing protein [Rhizobacter sp.]|nr:T9SS type A sorting domain-containing protein [Chlorobiales bacterium]